VVLGTIAETLSGRDVGANPLPDTGAAVGVEAGAGAVVAAA
jgi:hypothetical protein